MRYRAGVISLIGVAGLCLGNSLLACGDKFLVAGRGARFQHGSAHATVLIYAPPSSALHGNLGGFSVDKVLSREGYRPATASSAQELSEALEARRPDVVLVDMADAQTVGKQASAGPAPAPTVVPVLYKATRKELSEARKTWGVALKSPASSDSLLDAVDSAVELRAKAIKNAGLKP
jgi:hypothetical protein